MKTPVRRAFGLALAGVTLAALAACGGCDDTYLDVKGFAATGLALEGASVSVQCAFGNGSATTNTSGAYVVTVTNGVGPCLVTASNADKSIVMHSIAPASASGVTVAHVTPISTVIVESLVAAKGPTASLATLVTDPRTIPSTADINNAAAETLKKVNDYLESEGQPKLDPDTNLLSHSSFTPATNSLRDIGDAMDKALDFIVDPASITLPPVLVSDIKKSVDDVVSPNPTGSTGAN